MVPLIRSGKRLTGLNLHFLPGFLFLAATSLSAQNNPFLCSTTATNQVVRAEGLAEPVGSILLSCSGTPGQTINANLTVLFPTAITNRINATSNPVDQILTVDYGTGPNPVGQAAIITGNQLVINGIVVTVPPTKTLTLKLANIRLAIAPISFAVTASLSSTALSVNNAMVTVATPMPGLLSTGTNTGITCTGSPLPTTFDLPSFFAAGTRFNSLRVTEGFGNAFVPKDPLSDAGTRIIVNYSNFPAGSRVFLPDYVAGNDATQPTAAGDLGGANAPTGGVYMPTANGTLLLARVLGHDANGAGGAPIGLASAFPAGPTALKSATEVPLNAGAGIAVYEVIDANAATQESAQFPTFLGLNAPPNQPVTVAGVTLSLAPVSLVQNATSSDPIPRFRRTTPPSDCTFIGDCSSNYFPMLSVGGPAAINFRSPFNGLQDTEFFQILNLNPGSLLTYSATVTYTNGNGFVFLDPTTSQGTANATLRVIVNAAGLVPGTYQAQIVISAGSAGSRTIPVTVTVDPFVTPPPPAPVVTVTSVTNAATLTAGPLVAGSLGTIKGTNLAGTNVAVAFDGIAATILYKSATQINFQVPIALGTKTSSQLLVTIDGNSSAAQTVMLAVTAPGIFGILNQDGTVNSAANPAQIGTVAQVFLTGLNPSSGVLSAAIGSFTGIATASTTASILYSGDAPGLPGVQQVNIALPSLGTATPAALTSLGGTLFVSNVYSSQAPVAATYTIYVRQ